MKALTNYINAMQQHIQAGKTLRQALDLLKPIYDKAEPTEQRKIKLEIAQHIGKEHGVKPIITTQGNVGFDRKAKGGDAARKMLSYYFPAKSTKPSVTKQIDPVQQLITKYKSLSPAEKRRFLASL